MRVYSKCPKCKVCYKPHITWCPDCQINIGDAEKNLTEDKLTEIMTAAGILSTLEEMQREVHKKLGKVSERDEVLHLRGKRKGIKEAITVVKNNIHLYKREIL